MQAGTVDVEAISGYDGLDASASNYDIEDTATALISAGDSVLNVSGVANVTVDAPEQVQRLTQQMVLHFLHLQRMLVLTWWIMRLV